MVSPDQVGDMVLGFLSYPGLFAAFMLMEKKVLLLLPIVCKPILSFPSNSSQEEQADALWHT